MAFIFLVNLKTATNQFIRMKLIIFLIFINGLSLSLSAPTSQIVTYIKYKCPIVKDSEEFFKQEAITKCSNINVTLVSSTKYLESSIITTKNSDELLCVLLFNNLFTFCEKLHNASISLEPVELIPKGSNDFTTCNSLANITSIFHNNSHICDKYCISESGDVLPQCFLANYYAFYQIKVKNNVVKSEPGIESQVSNNQQDAQDAGLLNKDSELKNVDSEPIQGAVPKSKKGTGSESGTNIKIAPAVAKNAIGSNNNGAPITSKQATKVLAGISSVVKPSNSNSDTLPPPVPLQQVENEKVPQNEQPAKKEQPQAAPEILVHNPPKKNADETKEIPPPPQQTSGQRGTANGESPKLPGPQPVEPEQQQVGPEQQPVVPVQQPVVPEQQPVVPEQQPVVPEQQPVVPEQQPEAPEQTQDNPDGMGANDISIDEKKDITDMEDEDGRQLETDDDQNLDGEPDKDQMETVKETKMEKPDKIEEDVAASNSNLDDIDGESYFFSYFMVVCVLFVLGYIFYHNRTKVMALVLEGKRGKRQYRGRRPNSANYHKLDSNLEEAISSSCSKNSSNVIY